ncbi:MAG: GmrSD restriction endonuclease domain-containing protein [Thermomicrobiales bacterium]
MAISLFKTNPYDLHDLLKSCHTGKLQLPDFQRSWVWDEERIRSLIASISRSFPVGALMTLETGGSVDFRPRLVEGGPVSAMTAKPEYLLLDGQQRMTSLYQVTLRGEVMETVTPKKKRVKRWFYIDILKALDESADREEAIVGVPEDRKIRSNFGKDIDLDLSTRELEFKNLMFPMTMLFNWGDWYSEFIDHIYTSSPEQTGNVIPLVNSFKKEIIDAFEKYQIPVIALDKSTSKEAVCTVFEKVNTGGKPLDAFELITAMYAAEGHELRKDWFGDRVNAGRHQRLKQTVKMYDQDSGILANVTSTDFLHVVSLFHTRDRRRAAQQEGKTGKDLPQVSGNRHALLNLPLEAYKKYEAQAEEGFIHAAKFLHVLHIYRIFDLPYQSQIVPLAAILAAIKDKWEHEANKSKLVQWYWNGVFGELYGSTTETRIAKDFIEVPKWLEGGETPSTIQDCNFRSDRLKTMRMRLSAAYKGVNALLMLEGAHDLRSGQAFDHAVFFGENVDIHHLFPQAWCKDRNINPEIYDSIINKTPLSYRTNRIIGGDAPSKYLHRLEQGSSETPAIDTHKLNLYLKSHLVNPELLRTDSFECFMEDRQRQLVRLISQATGKDISEGLSLDDDGEEGALDEDADEAAQTISM